MGVNILCGNVLDSKADAVILTIDGTAKGMEGNIARAFARRWPEVWKELEEEIPYPLPLGEVFDYEPASECPFKLILVASTLHHKEGLDERAKKSMVRSALEEAITLASECSVKNIATAIMSGGWRLSQSGAFIAMTEGYEMAVQAGKAVDTEIYVLDKGQYDTITSIARSMGWLSEK